MDISTSWCMRPRRHSAMQVARNILFLNTHPQWSITKHWNWNVRKINIFNIFIASLLFHVLARAFRAPGSPQLNCRIPVPLSWNVRIPQSTNRIIYPWRVRALHAPQSETSLCTEEEEKSSARYGWFSLRDSSSLCRREEEMPRGCKRESEFLVLPPPFRYP